MKLQTEYWKNADGSIKVTIKVGDKGDFPTANIFVSNSESPADEGRNLGEGTTDSITKNYPLLTKPSNGHRLKLMPSKKS